MAAFQPVVCHCGGDNLNSLDYEFFEYRPEFELEDSTSHYAPFYYLEWNDLKDEINNMGDRSLLSDPNFIKTMQSSFIDKMKDAKYSIIRNEVTGEYIFPMTPFRGNKAHSRKKRKRMQPIIDAFAEKEFSRPVKGMRPSEVRQVHALMITSSYTRDYSNEEHTKQGFPIKKWNSYDAWKSITPLVNQFKMELSRIVGEYHLELNEENNKQSSYGSCLVKEGCADMYPAPHLIILFDKPMLAHRYKKQWPSAVNLMTEVL
ncbi:MAG: hypothetical protein FWG96_05835 [Methanomassiliicoccaceae archaeon]|nr:hypothetical protein [Methanomassiliicoccaceae archaeon]